jgi:hypothetical protein
MNHTLIAILKRSVQLLAAILFGLGATAALALDPHVEAVIRTVEGAKGRVEKTADGQSLRLVDLAVPNTGPHDHRKEDPYDAAFFEHLGHVTTLESLNVISTKADDEWIKPLGRLTNLTTLRFTNNGRLTDAGMETFAGLENLETFSFVGTWITGKAYAKCRNWTKVTRVSHRGSQIDDAGLGELCGHLPNLRSLSLAHAKFTDAGAVHLAKLTKLESIELGTLNATPAALRHLVNLPLVSIQLGEGFHSAEAFSIVKAIPTLRSLSITDGSKLTDADLAVIAGIGQLESLTIDSLPLSAERLPALVPFARLKALTLALRSQGYPPETQAKVRALLPQVDVKFVK